jgi:myo-inositol catabolism protein IolC
MNSEIIALIVAIVSFLILVFFVYKKIPKIKEIPESESIFLKKEVKEKVKVSVWKLEGFSKKQWENVIKSTNKGSKIVLLGRGEDKSKVSKWMRDASGYKEIIGFAIGRTIFLEPLKEYQNNKSTKEETIKKISDNFNYFINLWTTLKRKKL